MRNATIVTPVTIGPIHPRSGGPLYDWRDVLAHVRTGGRVLSRNRSTEAAYSTHSRAVLDEHCRTVARSARRRCVDAALGERLRRDLLSDRRVALEPALFPYALRPPISHLVLWVSADHHARWRRDVGVHAWLRSLVGGAELTWVQNLAGERSVESLPHYHVFLRDGVGGVDLRGQPACAADASLRTA